MSVLFDSGFLNKIQHLVLNYKTIVSGGDAGNRKSRSKGSSVEFSDYREYAIGDDFRRIDWNAYGRFERLFIKLFTEEREASVTIFLDNSKSMDWGDPNKSFSQRRIAAALSYLSLSNYDKVNLVGISDKSGPLKKSLRGKNSFADVLKFLEALEYEGRTNIPEAFKDFNMAVGRGISILISDLLTPDSTEGILNYLKFRKQEVFVLHLLAPQESGPQINESLRIIDSETGEYREITAAASMVKSYTRVFNKFVADIEEKCYKRGASYIRVGSDMPVEEILKIFISRI